MRVPRQMTDLSPNEKRAVVSRVFAMQPCVGSVQANQVCWQRKSESDPVSRPHHAHRQGRCVGTADEGHEQLMTQRSPSSTRRPNEAEHMSDGIIQMTRAIRTHSRMGGLDGFRLRGYYLGCLGDEGGDGQR